MNDATSVYTSILVGCTVLLLGAANQAEAAEMHVRAECCPRGTIVTLGDLVNLRCDSTEQAERLARITLFPAPAPGMRRFVTAREIQDMLLVRGIDLIDHNFRGAASVLVVGRVSKAKATANVRLATASPRLAQKKLEEALIEHLNRTTEEPWQVDFSLSEEAAQWVAAAESLSVGGDDRPAEGRQCFEVRLKVGDKEKTLDVVADVSLPPLIVVPVRAIPRQSRIGAADVELRRLTGPLRASSSVTRIEDAVGKETVRTLAVGKPIDRSALREPILVRRNEIVSVIVRAAGIRVRTQARARDNGAKGELVAVESLTERKTYFAQVSGVREVEVLATGVTAGSTGQARVSRR